VRLVPRERKEAGWKYNPGQRGGREGGGLGRDSATAKKGCWRKETFLGVRSSETDSGGRTRSLLGEG